MPAALREPLGSPAHSRHAVFERLRDWLRQPPTRFTAWRAAPARLVLLVLAGSMLWGASLAVQPGLGTLASGIDPAHTDSELYRAIVARIAGGEGYYPAVVAEQRQRDYPLRPVLTVRSPVLATVEAAVGPLVSVVMLDALTVVAWLALVARLVREIPARGPLVAAAWLGALGLSPSLIPDLFVWHEAWSVVFVVLSLACRSRRHWVGAVLLGFVAVTIRELALPYLCVMALVAWLEGSRREAAAWSAAIGLFALLLSGHASILSSYLVPGDPASQGWVKAGGWGFVLSMLKSCTLLIPLPMPAISCVALLALLGWAAWPGPFGLRGALLLGGYVCAFMLVGRPDNFYWGLMIGPLLLVGLALVPAALRDLVRAAMPPRAVIPD